MNRIGKLAWGCAFWLAAIGTGQLMAQPLTGQDSSRNVITTAVPFMIIAPDARSGALGDAGVALSPDANSVHWNVGKLAFVENDFGASISYTPWLGKIINDMWISYLSGYYKISQEQAVGLNLRYFDLGDIQFTDEGGPNGGPIILGDFNPREYAIEGSYSRKLSENFGIGVTLKYIHSNLTGNFTSSTVEARPGTSVAASIGIYGLKDIRLFGANSNIAYGLQISDIGQKMTYTNEENEEFIPTNLRLGTAITSYLDPYNKLTFLFDLNKLLVPTPSAGGNNQDVSVISGMVRSFSDAPGGFSEEMKEITVATGLEYWYKDIFSGRMGYHYEHRDKGNRKFLTFGVGFRYQSFGADLAYLVPTQQNHPLAETLRVSVQFNFMKKSKTESITETE